MSSDFEKNAIRITEAPSTKVAPPDTSKDIKLFQEKGKLYTKDFAGNVLPVTPEQQELKVAQVAVNTNEDANEYILRIPSPNAKLQALEASLRALVSSTAEDFAGRVEAAKEQIASWRSSQEAANGVFDSSISEIENKVSEIDAALSGKTDISDFARLQSDLTTIVTNINNTIASLATVKQLDAAIRDVKGSIPKIPEPINIVADSSNVTINKRGNEVGIEVDIPKVIQQVAQSGGGGGKGIKDAPKDGNIYGRQDGEWVVTGGAISSGLQGRFQLNNVDTTFTINHSAIDESVEFPVASLEVASSGSTLAILGIHNRTSTSFQVTLSGVPTSSDFILWHISTQSAPGMTTISSSGGSIVVTQVGDNFNLEVASAPPQNLADLGDVDVTGVVNGQTIKYLDGIWVAAPDITGSAPAAWGNIIGNIADQADLQGEFVNVVGDTMTGTLAMSGAGIQLDTNYTPPHSEGKIFYDAQSHTLSYFNDNPDVKINVGQEEVVRVRNDTGSTILNGRVCCISGSSGSHPLIVLADNTDPGLSHRTLGVATHDISDNENGYITVSGLVNGLNTSGFSTEGVTIWLGTAGQLTETEPTAPNHKVKVGYLIRKHNTQGSILVAIDTGLDLRDLHDVSIGDYDDGALLVAQGAIWTPGANINDYALDDNVVHTTGNESISGTKTFYNQSDGSLSAVIADNGVLLYGYYNVPGELTLDTSSKTLYSGTSDISGNPIGIPSINFQDRSLIRSNGYTWSLNWEDKELYDDWRLYGELTTYGNLITINDIPSATDLKVYSTALKFEDSNSFYTYWDIQTDKEIFKVSDDGQDYLFIYRPKNEIRMNKKMTLASSLLDSPEAIGVHWSGANSLVSLNTTTTVDTYSISGAASPWGKATWDLVLNDGTNTRSSVIESVFNATTVNWTEHSILETAPYTEATWSVNVSGGMLNLVLNITSGSHQYKIGSKTII